MLLILAWFDPNARTSNQLLSKKKKKHMDTSSHAFLNAVSRFFFLLLLHFTMHRIFSPMLTISAFKGIIS